jgi:hypothetical protein
MHVLPEDRSFITPIHRTVSTVDEAQKVRLPPPKNCPMKKVAADHGYVTSTRTGIVTGGLPAGGADVVGTGHAVDVTPPA